MLVDTHCHLGDTAFDPDRAEVVERARTTGVGHIVIVADTLEATATASGLAEQFGLSATAGVHPHAAQLWSDGTAAAVRTAAADPLVVAIGETGLDYHYDFAPRDQQRVAFEAQLALAAELGRPVVVHSREADTDMAELVRTWGERTTIVLHSFSAGPAVFAAGLAAGAYFSFSGMVTFRNWSGQDHVTACPADRLLLETDAPYLAPVPHRGKRNEPAYVNAVAARVAELRGLTPAAVADLTTANAVRCFGPRLAHDIPEGA